LNSARERKGARLTDVGIRVDCGDVLLSAVRTQAAGLIHRRVAGILLQALAYQLISGHEPREVSCEKAPTWATFILARPVC
jgi:hypothetical protein